MKLIGVVLFPIAALILWSRFVHLSPSDGERAGVRGTVTSASPAFLVKLAHFLFPPVAIGWFAVLAATCAITLVGLDLAIDRGAFLRHFHQSWMSHFAPAISSEYGSPNDHRFPFTLLLKNWDLTIPAAIGVLFLLQESLPRRRARNADFPVGRFRTPSSSLSPSDGERARGEGPMWTALVPVVWLAFALALFTTHTPWWTYYYIHIAIPLCLCAGFGLARLFEMVGRASPRAAETRKSPAPAQHVRSPAPAPKSKPAIGHVPSAAIFGLYSLCALFWMSSGSYLDISGIGKSPQTYCGLVLSQMNRFKHFT